MKTRKEEADQGEEEELDEDERRVGKMEEKMDGGEKEAGRK